MKEKEEMTLKFKLTNGKYVRIFASMEEREDGLYIITKVGCRLPETIITNNENPYVVSED